MTILLSSLSILVITVITRIISKTFNIPVCSICVGIFMTVVWMIAAFFMGMSFDPVVLGIMAGGAVVGIAYKIEPKVEAGPKRLWFKTFFMILGFAAVYYLINASWPGFIMGAILLAGVTSLFTLRLRPAGKAATIQKQLEDDCC